MTHTASPSLEVRLERLPTPLGEMLLMSDGEQRLRAIDWHDYEDRMHRLLRRQYRGVEIRLRETPPTSPAAQAMQEYFDGNLTILDTLPVALGGTDFQRDVWMALRGIPAGQTLSYRELAERIGRPTAVRAVGLANGANPVSVVLPCHRVVGSNASLTGYAGGLPRKHWLLTHERAAAISGQAELF